MPCGLTEFDTSEKNKIKISLFTRRSNVSSQRNNILKGNLIFGQILAFLPKNLKFYDDKVSSDGWP